jgi:ribonuclease D
MSNHSAPLWVDNPHALQGMIDTLGSAPRVAFDTEYDSFKRSYGFKLLLLQFTNGHEVFIVDPLSGMNLQPLWNLLERTDIQKVVYSGSEDIALLKAMGCNIQNLFDVQIAATLSNHPARNLGGLIEAETGEALDKSEQQSDWSVRPLKATQLSYAANDVIHLLPMADSLTERVVDRGLLFILEIENKALEEIEPRSHTPKLKPYHSRQFSDAFCATLLELLEWRDGVAREMDVPPVHIVDLLPLEKALQDPDTFLQRGEFHGFHYKVKKNASLRKQVETIIRKFDPTDQTRTRERKPRKPFYTKEETDQMNTTLCLPFKQLAVDRYGELTAEYLLRGLKKLVTTPEPDLSDLKPYQLELYRCMKEGLEWPLS